MEHVEGAFSHILTYHPRCTPPSPCLVIEFEASNHEIDIDSLDRKRFKEFVENANTGKFDVINLPGKNCGKWSCKDHILTIEIYSCGNLFTVLSIDLNGCECYYGERLSSIVESIEMWDTGCYTRIHMDYDEWGYECNDKQYPTRTLFGISDNNN